MYSEPCARLTKSMMPNTSVSPAASRNSSRPNCRPFSDCSMRTSMNPWTLDLTKQRQHICAAAIFLVGRMICRKPPPGQARRRVREIMHRSCQLLHRTFVVEAILVVLDDGGHRLERELAVGVLDHVLQVEILDRDVVVAVFERAAQRLEVGL